MDFKLRKILHEFFLYFYFILYCRVHRSGIQEYELYKNRYNNYYCGCNREVMILRQTSGQIREVVILRHMLNAGYSAT